MSKLDTNHVVNLDLVKDRVNSVIKFGLADVETSDFYLGLYNNGSRVFDKDYIVTLYIVKPNGTFRNIELEPKEGLKKYYCNLPDTLKNIPGEYLCQAIIFDNLANEKKISKSKFKYSVDLDLASEIAGIIGEEEQESILTNILNRLLTLENPVEPYATQKHVDECVSTLTEEIDTIKVKDTEQDGRLVNIESKNTEQDGRLNAVETKNNEQDNRLDIIEAKDIEQDNKLVNIESKNTEQNEKLNTIESKDIEQDERLNSLENRVDGIDEKIVDTIEPSLDNYGNRLDALETKDINHESRMSDIESKNVEQDNRLDIAENRLDNIGNDITNTMQPIIDAHTSRLNDIEAIDVAQNTRLDAIEIKNQEQDNRLLDIEKVNKKQDMNLKCLFAESKNNMIDIAEEGNSIYLQNSTIGYTLIDEIKGNTLVNCNKEPDKELILNGNINTNGDNTVTITEGINGGLVDVFLEGNTLVNVSKTKDSTALPLDEELTYLYANTQYTVQFIADKAITADITLGGTQLLAQPIVAGLNRISITTPETLVDNKLVISGVGANISDVVVTNTDREFGYFEGIKSVGEGGNLVITSSNSDNSLSNTQTLTHAPLRSVGETKDRYVLLNGNWYIERKCGIRAYQEGDIDTYKTDLVNTVYPLDTPTYEPIDYNPLEVYSGTTHITTNSTIPTNITVKNHGFNCLLKPSTTYTVSSNLGLNTVTTPSTLTEDCLRFMDTDTSDVTTMKDVLVLEGDWTTKADLIPANFSGIESAFEQEYDGEKGKYKVNVKIANEDKTKENNITFYINEPLRGVGDIKDRVYIKDDKVVVQRNCAEFIINDTNQYNISSNNSRYPSVLRLFLHKDYIPNYKGKAVLCDTLPYYGLMNKDYIGIGISAGFDIHLPLPTTSTISEAREYLKNNPLKVVYQLAEPTYEEVEYNDTKLFIESFKNSTLSYNSNVPVTSKLYYSYSVPIVDTVAQTANVTDQQDSMIIDLATQCAIMEMMLM